MSRRAEMKALERRLAALCRQLPRLVGPVDPGAGREARLQRQALAERRAQALRLLAEGRREPAEMRIARLERMLGALDCSRVYFSAAAVPAAG